MNYTIEGELAQVARLKFDKGETCWASKGSLMSLSPDVQWSLKIPGGIGETARRILSGSGISLTYVEASRDGQEVVLSPNSAGKIMVWDLEDGPVLTTRGAFVAAFGSEIHIDVVTAKRAGAALFGGGGLFLQKISGQGKVLIHGAGDFSEKYLQKNESLLVSTGNLAAFSEKVDYDIQRNKGGRRILFSGEGLFMTKLLGPGRVFLRSIKRSKAKTTAPST